MPTGADGGPNAKGNQSRHLHLNSPILTADSPPTTDSHGDIRRYRQALVAPHKLQGWMGRVCEGEEVPRLTSPHSCLTLPIHGGAWQTGALGQTGLQASRPL